MNAVPHPGRKLREIMQERGVTYKQAAVQLGISESMVGFIIGGRHRITSKMAIKLGAWTCNEYPAHYWNAAQFAHDLDVATNKLLEATA